MTATTITKLTTDLAPGDLILSGHGQERVTRVVLPDAPGVVAMIEVNRRVTGSDDVTETWFFSGVKGKHRVKMKGDDAE